MDAVVAGQPQTIEAWRDGQQVQMRATVGGQAPTKAVPLTPHTLVLDNLIASHYQVLLHSLGGKVEGSKAWSMLVPQRLAAVQGKLTAGPVETGKLNGKPVRVRRYSAELGNVLVEFWGEAGTNKLMKIYVPVQDVNLIREGFALTPKPAAERKGPSAYAERTLTLPSDNLQVPGTL